MQSSLWDHTLGATVVAAYPDVPEEAVDEEDRLVIRAESDWEHDYQHPAQAGVEGSTYSWADMYMHAEVGDASHTAGKVVNGRVADLPHDVEALGHSYEEAEEVGMDESRCEAADTVVEVDVGDVGEARPCLNAWDALVTAC